MRARLSLDFPIGRSLAATGVGSALGAVSYPGRILCMPRGNPSPKLASARMTTAAREALKRRAGLAAIELWETEHGRFTPDEMNEARGMVRAQFRRSRAVRRPA